MNMYTKPEYRRQGIAYKTLDILVDEIKNRGIYSISLEATEMVVYFARVGRLFFDISHYILLKNYNL